MLATITSLFLPEGISGPAPCLCNFDSIDFGSVKLCTKNIFDVLSINNTLREISLDFSETNIVLFLDMEVAVSALHLENHLLFSYLPQTPIFYLKHNAQSCGIYDVHTTFSENLKKCLFGQTVP